MEIADVLKKLEIIIEETDKELYEKGADELDRIVEVPTTDAEALLDCTWLRGYFKCACDLKMEIEEELENE
jgi:hypothetical protein